jgi:hypothetical protein
MYFPGLLGLWLLHGLLIANGCPPGQLRGGRRRAGGGGRAPASCASTRIPSI